MEAVGVNTAFITIPGHIYSAFRLNMSHDEARRSYNNPADLILEDDGTVWVPVTYGNGVFVAVSRDGTDQVMHAPWAP